jgi:hypothetical protein
MFRGDVNTFALVINYLNDSWIPQHVTIGLFEVHDTTWFPWLVNYILYLKSRFNALYDYLCFEIHETTWLSMVDQLRSLLEK